jgi:hypothetical protein
VMKYTTYYMCYLIDLVISLSEVLALCKFTHFSLYLVYF